MFGNDLGEAWVSVVRNGYVVDVIGVVLNVRVGCIGRLTSMFLLVSCITALLRAAVLMSASVFIVIPSGNATTI
jgi:hypothetical protein